jgi:hypothetical protein
VQSFTNVKAKLVQVFFRNRHNYVSTFTSNSGKYTLEDLSKFVRLNDDIYREDPGMMKYLAGQQSVIRRITHIMKMTDDQIANLTRSKEEINE